MEEDFILPGNIEELMELLKNEDIQEVAQSLVVNYYKRLKDE